MSGFDAWLTKGFGLRFQFLGGMAASPRPGTGEGNKAQWGEHPKGSCDNTLLRRDLKRVLGSNFPEGSEMGSQRRGSEKLADGS